MRLSDFDFSYPEELVAQEPLEPRESARCLLTWKAPEERHQTFRDLPHLLTGEEVFVFNNTKVIPARLYAHRSTGGRVEIFLLKPLNASGTQWSCLIKPSRRIKSEETLRLELTEAPVVIHRPTESGDPADQPVAPAEVVFDIAPEKVTQLIHEEGRVPLPPYIRREATANDRDRYQTVFAAVAGAVAAPTAGLHFSKPLISRIVEKGCRVEEVTLHVGVGTFASVVAEDIEHHVMHSEEYDVRPETVERLQKAAQEGREIICVGTTALRAVETALAGQLQGATDVFFYPGKPPRFVRSLITNFHQPKTTLFMLVCSLLGVEKAHAIYREAFEKRYRLFSYGDGMWIRILN